MKKELTSILESEGIQILAQPELLRQRLLEMGCGARDAITLELILKSCPAVGASLVQGGLSKGEVQALISGIVRETGLSSAVARRMMGALLCAAHIQKDWYPVFLLPELRRTEPLASPEVLEEDRLLEKAKEAVRSGNNMDLWVSDMVKLSEGGNGRASYLLACYYGSVNGDHVEDFPKTYFERAAQQGYGPAYGALASLHMNGRKRNLKKAASYFAHPAALAGKEGRTWADNAADLMRYRQENLERGKRTLSLLGLSIVLTACAISFFGGWMMILALVIQGLGFCWELLAPRLLPYYSHRYAHYGLMASWALALLALL